MGLQLNHSLAELVLPLTREWIEISPSFAISNIEKVLPLTREWIEIGGYTQDNKILSVLPLTREWIEMGSFGAAKAAWESSPSYEGVD